MKKEFPLSLLSLTTTSLYCTTFNSFTSADLSDLQQQFFEEAKSYIVIITDTGCEISN